MLIRFEIAIRFIKLIKNPLHIRSYNFEKVDWSRFRNRLKQFAVPVLALYYSQNLWINDELDLLIKEMQNYI